MLIQRQKEDETWEDAARFAARDPYDTMLRFCAAEEGSYRIRTAASGDGLAAELTVWPDRIEMQAPRAMFRGGE